MKKLTVILALTILAACSPKKSSVKSNTGSSATIAGVTLGQCDGSTGTVNSTQGGIFDTSATSYNFENQVKALLSATMSPYDVGSVSAYPNAQTGVRFKGVVKLDANGAVVGAQSKILISVYDSIYVNNKYTNPNEVEIQIEFDPAKLATITGQFDTQTGTGYLSLKDKYGEVRFDGTVNAQNFSGTVRFQNSVTVLSGSSPASGSLGQFQIQRCGLLQ